MHKFFNLSLALIFLTLVILFAYKEVKKTEVLTVSVNEPSTEQTTEQSNKLPSTDTGLGKTEIQQVIKDYLMDNPEVIIASLEGLNTKKLTESVQKASEYLKQNRNLVEQEDAPPVFGNPDGDITIIVFYDYNCSFCKKASEYENELIASDPGVKVILRPIPILGESSLYATKVALAVQKISAENFRAIHNDLMKMKDINVESVKSLLAKYKIEYSLVENEVNSHAIKQLINKNFDFAKGLGIKGTPSYIINGNFAPGLIPIDKFKNIIIQLRAIEEGPVVKKGEQEATVEK
ncbi:MAG: DsbA family protein [Rickettsiaceae bacterium]